jgi:type VI secretion system protein ImpL
MDKGPLTLRGIFGLIVAFLFFEAAVAVLTLLLAPDANVFVSCTIMTLLGLAVWVVIAQVMRSPAPSANPATPKPVSSSDIFATEVRKLIAEANCRLSESPNSPKSQLAGLPLYLIAGTQGTGKTSAIVNSSLEPRLLAGQAFRESRIASTDYCNFWFANGAILADISGQIFQEQPENWETLLRLLCGRERRPFWRRIFSFPATNHNLRGVVLVNDTKSFLSSGEGEQASARSRLTHERLQTVGAIFRVDFPVYALFANADEVPHFSDFFGHLAEFEDQRTLGATIPLAELKPNSGEVYADTASRTLTHYFNRLCASLASKRIAMLARESVPERRGLIYEFPREMRRLRPELVRFLVDVFRPNPLQRGAKLRGFYFSGIRQASHETSALEEIPSAPQYVGSDATYFLGLRSRAVAATVLSPPAIPAATIMRWSFLPELFSQVVLADHAGMPTSFGSAGTWRRTAAFGATATLALLLCMVWTVSWSKNRSLLANSEAALYNLQSSHSFENLGQLDALRSKIEELESGPPLSMRWGLYAGDRAISALRTAYFARFRGIFLDPALASFPSSAQQNYATVYSHLKVYRTVVSGACRADKAFLDATLPAMLPWSASLSAEEARLARRQIDFYTTELKRADPYRGQFTENEEGVRRAQTYLNASKGPDRLLRSLVDRLDAEHPGLSLAQYAPNYREVLSGPDQIEWAYTNEGREAVLKKIRERDFGVLGEPCVVGAGQAASGVANLLSNNGVEALYIQQYIQRWKQFLSAFSIVPYRDPQDAANKLAVLADGNRSPLLALLYMAGANTYVEAQSKAPDAARAEAERAANRGLSRWFPSLQRGRSAASGIVRAAPPQPRSTAADIAQAFQPVWSVVDPKSPNRFFGPTNATYVGGLAELGDAVRTLTRKLDTMPDSGTWEQANQAESKAMASARQLEGTFNRTSEDIDTDVKRLVEEPIRGVRAILPANPAQLLAQPANAAAAALCRDFQQLRRKYPFNRTASEEVSLDALNRFFAPGNGELAQFVQQPPFSTLLQRQGKIWIQNPASPTPRLSPQFLRALTSQIQLAEVLYPDDAAQPRFDYNVSLDATAPILFNLEAGSQTVRYTGTGSAPSAKFLWPNGSGEAALVLRTDLTVKAIGPGVWGIFRLLSKAQEHHGSQFVFSRLGFEGDSQPLRDFAGKPFTLRVNIDAGRASSLFEEDYFPRLSCAAKAVQ